MKIGRCNLDYLTGLVTSDENIALDKYQMFYELQGDTVHPWSPMEHKIFDIILVSSMFTFSDKSIIHLDNRCICGGTGFDISKKLPPEVEKMKPKKNRGFLSRGCNNNCKWCVVPKKEGKARPECELYDLWDGKTKTVKVWDNNILQLPEHFKMICEQLHEHKKSGKGHIKIDFNQGLDIRLVNDDVAYLLSSKYISHEEYHFAFDSSKLDKVIEQKVQILKRYGINKSNFYVLIGFPNRQNETLKENLEDAFYRLNLLRSLGQNVAPMPYRQIFESQPESLVTKQTRPLFSAIENWGYSHGVFNKMDFFKDYLKNCDRGKQYKEIYQMLGFAI